MSRLVDIVNLNADASCLSSRRWLELLEGGTDSELYRILHSYVEFEAKVNLGIVGSTLAEIQAFNPECIELINSRTDVFELILRPFIHSLSILWSDETFMHNVGLGRAFVEQLMDNVVPWYLPPEFALRNSQVYQLHQSGVAGTFMHPNRLKKDLTKITPTGLLYIRGLQGDSMPCIHFSRSYDSYYLDCLQRFHSDIQFSDELVFGWRDGESCLFLPNSSMRERFFVERSTQDFERLFLSEALREAEPKGSYTSYPQNSLLPWLGNFRLYWYMNEVKYLERHFDSLDRLQKKLFLQLLNSDILSSIEKNNVEVLLCPEPGQAGEPFEIRRKERNLDAEELFLEIQRGRPLDEFLDQVDPHFSKRLRARMDALDQIEM